MTEPLGSGGVLDPIGDLDAGNSQAATKNRAKVGFGSQIRNYFLHPSQRVKDSRTGYLEHNFNYVLDGNLQGFLDSYLKWRVKGEMAGALGDDE